MLEQDGITTTGCVEEMCAEVAIGQQHGNCTGQHRDGRNQQECGNQPAPGKDRHFHQRHAGRAHIEYRHDDVDRTHHRGNTENMHGKNGEINADTALR